MTGSWPGLGFDPAPGDPDAVTALAGRLLQVAEILDGAVRELATACALGGRWTGVAADAFAARVGALPGVLDEARDGLRRADAILRGWSEAQRGRRARALDLEGRARAGTGAAAPGGGAVSAAGAADLDAVLAEARALEAEHGAAAARAADELRGAAGRPSDHRAARAAIGAHLDDVGDVAGAISGIAGALAFVPVLTPVAAPVALAAGAVALAADVADTTVAHQWSDRRAVTDVAVDALALVPGVRLAKGLVGAVAGAAEVSSAVFRSIDGLTPAVTAGAATFARGEAAASAVYRQPGVWAVLQARAVARWSSIPVDAAARGFEVAGRTSRAVGRLARTGDGADEEVS